MTRGLFYEEFGGPQVLQVGEVGTLPMGPDTVRLRVAGAGMNPVDWKIMRGRLAGGFEHRFPIIPAWDVAGEVLDVGPSVSELQPGDTAYGYARLDVIGHGTAAEEVVLPIRVLAKAPATVDPVTAAAVPLAGLTALQMIRRLNVQPEETVLVHNAAGGVGQFAVQFARLAGCRVIGTASVGNHEHLRTLGVEPVAYGDGLADDVRALAPDGVDVVVDLIGGVLDISDTLMAANGRVGSITDAVGALQRGGVYVFVRPSMDGLAEIAQLIDSGDVVVDVADTVPFADAAAGYERLEAGHVRGKLVLVP